MRKLLVVPVALLGASLILSGCFVFVGMKHSKVSLKPGQKSVMSIYTRANNTGKDHPFVFLAISDTEEDPAEVEPAGPMRFDTKGLFTNNGLPLKRDDVLRDYILAEFETCGGVTTDSTTADYYAFVTEKRVDDSGKAAKQVLSKLAVKQESLADSPVTNVGLAVGGADADNDGVYETGLNTDTSCSGGAQTSILTKPVPSEPRAQRDAVREQAEQYLRQELR